MIIEDDQPKYLTKLGNDQIYILINNLKTN